jgi:hypothetical protein
MHRHLAAPKIRKQEERGGKTRSTAEEFALHASAPMPVYRVRVLKLLGYYAPPIQRSEPALEQSRVASYVISVGR